MKGIVKAIVEKTVEAVNSVQELKASLFKKGLTVGENEKLPELVEKVKQIQNYERIIEGTIMLVSPAASLTLTNFSNEPFEVAIYNPTLEDAYLASTVYSKAIEKVQAVFTEGVTEITVDNITISKTYDNEAESWNVVLSSNDHSTLFCSGHAYNYLVVIKKAEEEVL